MKIFKKILKKKSIDNEKRKNCEIINRWFEKNEKIINSIYPFCSPIIVHNEISSIKIN